MEFKIMREAVAINETVYEGSMEQPVDCDITLPDYCQDILRILKCQMIPRIGGYQIVGDRLTIEGSALIRLIYASEKNNSIHCYEFLSPFSRAVDLQDIPDNPSVRIKTCVEYVNCRAISPRRTDVHGAMSIKVKICARKDEELLVNVDEPGVQLKKKNIQVSSLTGDAQRQFTINEVLEIGSSKPAVQNIIRCEGVALLQEHKMVTNKLLIRGELLIRTLYSSDVDNSNLEVIEHSAPISQIIDIDGLGEDSECDIRMDLLSIDLQPKADAYGENRLFEITAKINASVLAAKTIEMPVITDAYSLNYDLNVQSRQTNLERLVEVFRENTLCRKTIDAGSGGISSLIDIWCSDINSTASQEGSEIRIKGDATVCLLCLDREGNAAYIERSLEFNFDRELKSPNIQMKCEPNAFVVATDYNISGDDKIDVRLEIKIEAAVFAVESGSFICNLEADNKRPKNASNAALTIYYADAGESVWDIARKYNTTVEAVVEENELKEDSISDCMMILIPGV